MLSVSKWEPVKTESRRGVEEISKNEPLYSENASSVPSSVEEFEEIELLTTSQLPTLQ